MLIVFCFLIIFNFQSLLRLNIVIPLLEVLYPIICEEDDDDDDEFEESESSTAASFACQVRYIIFVCTKVFWHSCS